jgi:hypothetical protein
MAKEWRTPLAATATAQEADVRVPSLAFGIREREQRMHFEHLSVIGHERMSTRCDSARYCMTKTRWP